MWKVIFSSCRIIFLSWLITSFVSFSDEGPFYLSQVLPLKPDGLVGHASTLVCFCRSSCSCCSSSASHHPQAKWRRSAIRRGRLSFDFVVSYFHHNLQLHLRSSVAKVLSIFLGASAWAWQFGLTCLHFSLNLLRYLCWLLFLCSASSTSATKINCH